MFRDLLPLLQLQDFVFLSGSGAVVLATLIQALSKKYKPWTWLASQFGKVANKEMLDKIDNLENKITKLEERDVQQDEKQEEEKAKDARRRILKCSDEIRAKLRHSEEYFNDVLDDITFYTQYCEDHPKFKNKKAVLAIQLVEKTYEKCIEDNDFL